MALTVTFLVWPPRLEAFQTSRSMNAAVNVFERYNAKRRAPFDFGTPFGKRPIIMANAAIVGKIAIIMTEDRSFHLSESQPHSITINAPTTPPGMLRMSLEASALVIEQSEWESYGLSWTVAKCGKQDTREVWDRCRHRKADDRHCYEVDARIFQDDP